MCPATAVKIFKKLQHTYFGRHLSKKSMKVYLYSFYGKEAATRGVPWENAFLEISQNSQENTCARSSFLIKLHAEAWHCVFLGI